MFAQVIIDIAHAQVDRLFTYAAPDTMEMQAGHHVRVPFGRGNKLTEGFVVGLSETAPEETFAVKFIQDIIEPYPVFTQEQLHLSAWIQETYNCLFVDALRLMIPSQLRGGRVHEKTRRMVHINGELDYAALHASFFTKDGAHKAPRQLEVLELLYKAKAALSTKDINAFIPGAGPAIHTLLKKGLLLEHDAVTYRRPNAGKFMPEGREVTLTEAQREAVAAIVNSMQNGGGVYLLHGVTGSGKTEVYLQCIQECLQQGKEAILLVPEIALTPQAMGIFRTRFGNAVAVLHSKLSAGERFDEWRRIRLGLAKVAVGARSAIFAPFEALGIIIVDEEHEQSYQSESVPRYNAIEVAIRRGAENGIPLVLGSATPGIQSYMRARAGRYSLLELPERISRHGMPAISIVDMREEFLSGNNGIFSTQLHTMLSDCLAMGKQAILFMNRRGYSTFVSCRGCGYVFQCPNCDIAATYHKTEDHVKCHYCGHTAKVPEICPSCGKPYLKYFGIGTQQVEEQLLLQFPAARALRMDKDSTQSKDAHETMLSAFARGEADVLIGTQMVAKGLDFPNVTLVGVIAADATLYLPDYRSSERTFQLLTQVAGRAGRNETPGSVVIQTYSPSHPSIRFSQNHDYKGFFAYELAQRHAALFPPFSLFVRILFQGLDEDELQRIGVEYAKGLEKEIEAVLGQNLEELLYLCAAPAPVKKRQGMFRYQVLVKLKRTKKTTEAIKAIYVFGARNRNAHFAAMEINPGDLL